MQKRARGVSELLCNENPFERDNKGEAYATLNNSAVTTRNEILFSLLLLLSKLE
jgi:hypothetical protein